MNCMAGAARTAGTLSLVAAACLIQAASLASPYPHLVAALEHSPDHRRAMLGIEVAEESVTVAKARGLPQVRGGASYRLDSPEAMGQGGPPDRLGAQIVIDQQVFNLETSAGISLAEIQLEIARTRVEDSRQQILLATYRAYLQTALAAENLDLIAQRRERLEEQLNIASTLTEVGRTNRLQMLNVQAQLASLEAERVSAENAVVTAGEGLRNLSGLDPVDIRRLARTLPPDIGGPDSWRERIREAPALRAAALEVDSQQQATQQLVASVLPSLLAEGTADKEFETSFNLRLSVPLYSSGGATAARDRSERQEDMLKAAYEAARDRAALEVSAAHRDFLLQEARIEALQNSVAVGEERLEFARTSIDASAGVLADALDAATDLASAELQLAQARHAQLQAYLSLLSATGGLDLAEAQKLESLFE